MTPQPQEHAAALVRSYKEIKSEYAYDPDIFTQEEETVHKIKWIIDNRLSVVDKTIILLYADCGSYRKLGQRMRLSHVTAGKEIKRIKAIIVDEYRKLKDL